jgi:hypothetical protein
MSAKDIRDLLRAKPFEPFRIVVSDGTIYEIRHPELVVPGLATAFIGYPDPNEPGIYERFDIVSMRHIIRLEPAPQPVKQV